MDRGFGGDVGPVWDVMNGRRLELDEPKELIGCMIDGYDWEWGTWMGIPSAPFKNQFGCILFHE